MGNIEERLKKQMEFLLEVDKLKFINRQTYLSDGKRKENDGEHSWHLALWPCSCLNIPMRKLTW